jgi:hypothetical protein
VLDGGLADAHACAIVLNAQAPPPDHFQLQIWVDVLRFLVVMLYLSQIVDFPPNEVSRKLDYSRNLDRTSIRMPYTLAQPASACVAPTEQYKQVKCLPKIVVY